MSDDNVLGLLSFMNARDTVPRSQKTEHAAHRVALGVGDAREWSKDNFNDRTTYCAKLRTEIGEIRTKLRALDGSPSAFTMQWSRDGHRGSTIDGKAALRSEYERRIRDLERLVTVLGSSAA